MTEQEIARKYHKYSHVINKKEADLTVLKDEIAALKTKRAKFESALIKRLLKLGKNVIVGKTNYYTSKTAGKIVVPDVTKAPKWAQKKETKVVPNLSLIKTRLKQEKITEEEDWFKFEVGTCLKSKEVKEATP